MQKQQEIAQILTEQKKRDEQASLRYQQLKIELQALKSQVELYDTKGEDKIEKIQEIKEKMRSELVSVTRENKLLREEKRNQLQRADERENEIQTLQRMQEERENELAGLQHMLAAKEQELQELRVCLHCL